MTNAEIKAKRKANRSLKRQQEHQEKMAQVHIEVDEEGRSHCGDRPPGREAKL